jgi:uncharacterized protein YxjI
MRFFIKKRQWTLIEEFKVRDQHGHDAFKIKGKFFHIGDSLRIIALDENQEVAYIHQKLVSLTPHYEIYVDDQHWATVHQKLFHFRGDRFRITLQDGSVYDLDGSLWNWNFSIKDDRGNLLAEVGRDVSVFESYGVDIVRDADVPALLALIITFEMVREHQRESDDEGEREHHG